VHLVLDYADGGELFKRIIKRGKYSEKTASIIMKKLLETLVYLNENRIVHRDIKPENILLKSEEDDTDFFLADFGLATFVGNPTLQLKCGSPGYVAPEILKGDMYGQAVDVFSCGVLLYILLSGRTPFPGNVAKEVLNKNKECKIHFRKKYWKSISH
jgi:serine/threonine protein kinase